MALPWAASLYSASDIHHFIDVPLSPHIKFRHEVSANQMYQYILPVMVNSLVITYSHSFIEFITDSLNSSA